MDDNGQSSESVPHVVKPLGHTFAGIARRIRELRGNLSAVARSYDLDRTTVAKWVKGNPMLEEAVRDAREGGLDAAEEGLYSAVDDGESWAIQFLLKFQGRTRGYIDRHELKVAPGELDDAIESELAGMAARGEGGPPRAVEAASGGPGADRQSGQPAEPLDPQQRPADGGLPQPGG